MSILQKIKKSILMASSICLISGLVLTAIGYFGGGIQQLTNTYRKDQQRIYSSQEVSDFSAITIDSTGTAAGRYQFLIKASETDQAYLTYPKALEGKLTLSNQEKVLALSLYDPASSSLEQVSSLKLSDLVGGLATGNLEGQYPDQIVLHLPKGKTIESLSGNFAGSVSLEDQKIKQADLTISTGDLRLDKSSVDHLKTDLTMGEAYLTDSKINKADLSLHTGDLSIESSQLKASQISLDTGDVYANDLTLLGQNQITNNMGDVDLNLASYDLTAKVQLEMGDSDLTSQLKSDSQNQLIIQSSMGDVTIQ